MASLVELLREHCEAIEYDLLIRGIDLRDLFTGRMSWRRFRLLVENLPPESRYMTDLRNTTDLSEVTPPPPGVYGPWPQTDMLLAQLVDLATHWMWANSDKDLRSPMPPKPYPRPGVETNVRAISAKAAAYLEFKRTHQGADPPEGWEPEVV